MIHGIINVYKEKGYTSHDVVAKMRGILKQKKIGHTGTLDPEAEGVLPVCLGTGTKLCDMLTDHDKEYRAILRLGIVTDTQDMTGQILSVSKEIPDEQKIRTTIESFIGEYDQVPPMYSALKVNGKKLYELAREGKTVERKARRVKIYDINVSFEGGQIVMTVQCSKGTYIRTLCNDIGEKLGCGGCMESLLRTKVGRFALENAITLTQLEELSRQGRVEDAIISVDEMFADLPAYKTLPEADKLLHNGNTLDERSICPFCVADRSKPEALHTDNGLYADTEGKKSMDAIMSRMYDAADNFWGLYQYIPENHMWKPVKMFPGRNGI